MTAINLSSHPKTTTGPWDEEHVKALLHFPRFPIRLIQQEPWQSWIGERGGLKAVYAYLQEYPLPPSHRRILEVVLSNPEAVSEVYADRLNISRATYFYHLRQLIPALVQALNQWQTDQADEIPTSAETPLVEPNLPAPLTSLIGVESILHTLTQCLLREDVRLLTLLGPGGVGKTRLAIELAHRLHSHFHGQMGFVDLSSQEEAAQVAQTIAQSLGLKDTEEASLKAFLRPRRFLLILDNFEQVLEARSLVTELLAIAPRLKIVVTSRAALRVYGEHEFTIAPMSLPAAEENPDLSLVAQAPAVRLFVQRAQEVNPSFTLTRENFEAVAELCRRMEGIPLAIEWAAFQVKYFSPQALLVRLSNTPRIQFLSQMPSRLFPPRQQNLRSMLEWSYRLLNPELRTLFNRLAIFPASFTLEAAEAICGPQAAHGLVELVDQSLLMKCFDSHEEARFYMLGICREYALEQLESYGEADTYRRAHAQYYLRLAEQFAASPGQNHCLRSLLQREDANLHTAIQWTLDQGESELALRFMAALWEYWRRYGNLHEWQRLAQIVLEHTDSLLHPLKAHIWQQVGWLAHDLGDYTTMLRAFQSSLEIAQALQDESLVGLSLQGLGELACLRGQLTQAHQQLQRSLEIFQARADDQRFAWSLDLLGRLELVQGHLSQAQAYFHQSFVIFQKSASVYGMTSALLHLGQALFYQGRLDEAQQHLEHSLEINHAHHDTQSTIWAMALIYLGEIAAHTSQQALARRHIDRGLQLSRNQGYNRCIELGLFASALLALQSEELESTALLLHEGLLLQQSLQEPWRIMALLESTASLLAKRSEGISSTRLYGAATALRRIWSIPPLPIYRSYHDEALTWLRNQLSTSAFEEAWNDGQDLSLEQALTYALRCLE